MEYDTYRVDGDIDPKMHFICLNQVAVFIIYLKSSLKASYVYLLLGFNLYDDICQWVWEMRQKYVITVVILKVSE